MNKELVFYTQDSGKTPFTRWISQIRDSVARDKITARLLRLEKGHYGDAKHLRAGVWELRIDFGPGFRIYFAEEKQKLVVVLLLGGTKKTQPEDINIAIRYWEDYKRRH